MSVLSCPGLLVQHCPRLSVQLSSGSHPSQRLDTLMHRHLSATPMLRLQLLVLVAARDNIIVGPVESVRHVVIALGHSWTVAHSIRDDGTV
jgi:hypothetical protein